MSWLQQRPQVSNPTMFYTVGLNKTLLIVGLGNIGTEFDGTRHNIGFDAVDAFVSSMGTMADWIHKKDLKCHYTSGQLGESRVLVIKPTTLMNNSGESVLAVASFFKLTVDHIVVVHDELDIDFGQIRMRVGGGAAGHNGINSITEKLGEAYGRVRIGIGPKKPARIDSADFVLQKFSSPEELKRGALLKEASAILSEYVFSSATLPTETRSFIF